MAIMKESLLTEGPGAKIILGEPVQQGYFYGYEGIVLHEEGGEQALMVFENPFWGRMLFINGNLQFTTRDEFIYHEALVHIPMQAFREGTVRRVLICGGGDFGAAREVLKYDEVEEVIIAEIDERVPKIVKKFFSQLLPENPDDSRLKLFITDAFKLVEELVEKRQRFDLIIVDSTDPDISRSGFTLELSHSLFSEKFHSMLLQLAPDGAIVQQAAVPFIMKNVLEEAFRSFTKVYPKDEIFCYKASVPSFGGDNAFVLRFSKDDPKEPKRSSIPETKYYTHEIHRSAFALPKFWISEVISRYA